MNLTIDLPDEMIAALKAQAQAQGVTPDRIISRALENSLARAAEHSQNQPFETGYGMWAKYGIELTDGDIDANRREMFRNFAEDL